MSWLGLTRSCLLLALGVGLVSAAGSCSSSDDTRPMVDAGVDQEAGLPPLESDPPALIKDKKDDSSSPVVFDALRGGVWTANGDVGSISYVDVDAQKVVQEIAIGKNVTSIALSPDKKWIAAVDREGATVSLVDAESRTVKRAITVGPHPRSAVWDAWDPRWLYVSIEDDDAVAVIDRTAGVLHHTVRVGRLPAGLAVSRRRHELTVLHRIDAKVTLVPLEGAYAPADQGEPFVDVPLADQPTSDTSTNPSGKPFAFESIAWAPDGLRVWLPHELLANFHPFQFQRVLFPAVSVVDLDARAEVVADPTSGTIDGRKVLFDAINVLDGVGNTSIVSQPCAARLHPNGFVAYVLACASEDLLTFDATSGMAVDLLRNLPGDHPTGMTLDDTGQRAFIVADQSHTMLTLDLANGNPVAHAHVIAGPLSLIAKDTVDPELRQGLELFFRANSSKGTLATTGNDWMSCGGCHLDGFVSTNQVFFDSLTPADPSKDAQIGHVGLKDLFSTTPDKTFDPHDVLVAMLDQGGLAPDRTGQDRTGAVDPAAPSDDAKLAAARLAKVIARDLPLAPSWLLDTTQAPNTAYDAEWCGNCHADEYAAWKKSVHAHSAIDPMVKYGMGVEQQLRGNQYSRQCAGCHDPVSLRSGDSSLASNRGITCLGCHDASRLIRAGGNADLQMSSHDWTVSHKARASADLNRLRSPEFCAGCHQQFVPGTGLVALSTFGEWHKSPYAGATAPPPMGDAGMPLDAGAPVPQTACIDCHMQKTNGIADHSAPGGNVYMATKFADAAFVDLLKKKLAGAISLSIQRDGPTSARITVQNKGVGHDFPTGVTDIREPWVELQGVDINGKTVARIGGPDTNGLIPASAARLGLDIASADGTVLLRHELTDTTRFPYDKRVHANGDTDFLVTVPDLPPGASGIDAVLYYRNVRTPYYRFATGDPTSSAPDVEVARVHIQ